MATPGMYPELGENCFCGLSSCLRQCTKGKPENTGRFFYTCPKNKDQDPCKYFAWADAPPKRPTTTRPNFAVRDFPGSQPPAPKKLKRSNAVADLTTCMTEPAPTTPLSSSLRSIQEWDARMGIISAANAQMLTKAVEQNTLSVDRLNKMIELLAKTMKKNSSPSGDESSDESLPTPPSTPVVRTNTQPLVNTCCSNK